MVGVVGVSSGGDGEFVCVGKMKVWVGKWRVLYVVVEELKGVGRGGGVEGWRVYGERWEG